jgi:hypothetical protein
MKKSRTPEAIKELSDSELREIIKSLHNVIWDDDAPLRTLAIKVHGDDTTLTMLMLGTHLAFELEERTNNNTSK